MALEDGPLYTPEQVCENGWLGPDTTPDSLRAAAGRGRIQHTRYPSWSKRGRIYFTAANIRAIHRVGSRQVGGYSPPTRRPRRKTDSVTELRPDVLKAEPGRARKRRSREAS